MLQRYSASQVALLGKRVAFCRRLIVVSRARVLPTDGNVPRSACPSDAHVHVTVVGGGAAGLTAAFFAAEHGAQVTVLERTREAGKKILMSGGSRCNVLPQDVDLQTDYYSDSSQSALRAVFASWSLELCRAWLEDPYWGVGLDLQLEEETKKYFPASNSAREVRDRLVSACLSRGVIFKYNASVEGLQQLQPLPQRDSKAAIAAAAAAQSSGAAATPAAAQHGGSAPQTQAPVSRSAHPEADGSLEPTLGGDVDGDGELAHQRRNSSLLASPSGDVGMCDVGSDGVAVRPGGKKGRRGSSRGVQARSTTVEGAVQAAGAPPQPTRWLCRLKDGTEHVTDKLIIATGGLSFPAVGTDGTGHRLLRALGHSLEEPYAALTPLTGDHPGGQQLAGVSMYNIELSVQVPDAKRPKVSERTALLFTHRGYSGPAILDLSHYAVKALTRGSVTPPRRQQQQQSAVAPAVGSSHPGSSSKSCDGSSRRGSGNSSDRGSGGGGGPYLERGLPSIRVNWTQEPPALWDERIRAGSTALVTTLLQRHGLRERLAEALVAELGLSGRRVCDVKKGERAALVSALTSYEVPYHGHEGYKKAEVTGGGVHLEELNCATMESRLLPGLFICGECVDLFGRIGGFNFYWAWVSGRLAGIGAAQGGLHSKSSERRRGAAAESKVTTAADGAAAASSSSAAAGA